MPSLQQIVTFGMPTALVESESARAAALASSKDPKDIRKKEGYETSSKSGWDFLPTFGLTNPYKKSAAKKPKKTGVPKSSTEETGSDESFLQNWPVSDPDKNLAAAFQSIDFQETLNLGVELQTRSGLAPSSLDPFAETRLTSLYHDQYTYSGSDLRVVVDIPGFEATPPKQLVELTTLTVSVHRAKCPVRSTGYENPKAFAYGTRTIAGTMILTQFWMDSLIRFLATTPKITQSPEDWAKDLTFTKVDKLPPFNLTLYFADEYGHTSVRRVIGVTAVTDGTVYSNNDLITEQTISFMALDFTPLAPADMVDVLRRHPSGNQKTPTSVDAEVWSPYKTKTPIAVSAPPRLTPIAEMPKGSGSVNQPGWLKTFFSR